MKKIYLIFIIAFFTTKIYSLNIDYNWSLGEFGFAFTNANKKINFDFNALEFNWMETTTGFGLGFKIFDTHFDLFDEEANIYDYYTTVFPLEIQWMPFVYKTKNNGFINFGIYDRLGWGNGWDKIPENRFNNTVGLHFVFSSIAMGRTKIIGKKNYSYNKSLFFEYSTTSNTFRIGFKIDYLALFLGAFAAVFVNDWNSSEENEAENK